MKKFKFASETVKRVAVSVISVVCIIAIISSTFVGGFYLNKYLMREYTVEAKVVEIVVDASEVYFKTSSGHIFMVVTDEIFALNENYLITFNSNGTATVEDDEIIIVSRKLKME